MVREDIIEDLFEMFNATKECGYSLIVDSGYLSYEYQLNILEENIKSMVKKRLIVMLRYQGE